MVWVKNVTEGYRRHETVKEKDLKGDEDAVLAGSGHLAAGQRDRAEYGTEMRANQGISCINNFLHGN